MPDHPAGRVRPDNLGSVRAALHELHEACAQEIAALTGVQVSAVRTALSRLCHAREIFVCAWRHDDIGGRMYIRAVYRHGQGKTPPRPRPLTRTEHNRRYRARTAVVAAASVFTLSIPIGRRTLAIHKDQP